MENEINGTETKRKVNSKRGRQSFTSSYTSSEGDIKEYLNQVFAASFHKNNVGKEGRGKEEQRESPERKLMQQKAQNEQLDRKVKKVSKKLPRSKLRRKISDKRVMARRGAMMMGSNNESGSVADIIQDLKKMHPF